MRLRPLTHLAESCPRQRLAHIEANLEIALLDWLIGWADHVLSNFEEYYLGDPLHMGRPSAPYYVTQTAERASAIAGIADPNEVGLLARHELAFLANRIASWRCLDPQPHWTKDDLVRLTDLSSYLP